MRGKDINSIIRCEDGEEFLRKFFQASITIPFYLEETLENYMAEIFDEIELSDEIDKIDKNLKIRIMQVIMSAYTMNPRRIKRYLNNLSILYILAKQKEYSDIIKKDLITKNLDFLAKIAIIREDWYEFYKYLESDNEALDLISKYIQRDNAFDEKDVKKIERFLNDEKYPGLKKFLISTRLIGINIKNIKPFLILHQDTYQSIIKDLDESQIRLRDGDVEYFKNILDKANDDEKKSYECLFIQSVRNYYDKGYIIYAFNTLNVIVSVYTDLINKVITSKESSSILSSAEFNAYLSKFNIDGIFELLKDAPVSNRNIILNKYFGIIEEPEIEQKLVDLFIINSDLLQDNLIKRMRTFIIENYNKNQEKMLSWIEAVADDKKAKKKIIDQEILQAVIESINIDKSVKSPVDENKKKVDLFWKLEDMAVIDIRSLFIIKMVKIIELSTGNKFDEIKKFGLENILKIKEKNITEGASNGLSSCFEKQYAGVSEPDGKLEFIKATFQFLPSFTKIQSKDLIEKCVINFIKSQDDIHANNIMKILLEFINEIPLQEEIINHFFNRIVKEFHHKQEIVDSFVDLTIESNKKEKSKNLIIELIKGPHYKLGLDSLNKHNRIFGQTDNDEIGRAIIKKYQNLSHENWSAFIAILINDDINFSKKFIDDLAENFLGHLLQNDENIRKIGKNYYIKIKNRISNSKAKEIGQQLINKLRDVKEKISDKTIPIIDVLIEEQDRLGRNIIEELIDILLYLTQESQLENLKDIAFNNFINIKKLYSRSNQVLNRFLNLAKQLPSKQRVKMIEILISFKKYKGRKGFWKEAKEYFKKLSESDKENNSQIGNWALKQLK